MEICTLATVLLGLIGAGAFALLILPLLIEYLVTPTFQSPRPDGAVLVTGASTGIGEDAAVTLAKKGFLVFAGVRKAEDGERLRAQEPSIVPVILDVTRQEQIDEALAFIQAELATRNLPLVGLMNNAGLPGYSEPIEFLTMPQLRDVFDVNFFGLVATTKAFLPLLREGRGRIVNMGSLFGIISMPTMTTYGCSKVAVEAVSDIMRLELLRHRVSVSVIEPAFIQSQIFSKYETPQATEAKERALPLYAHCFFKPRDQQRSMANADPPSLTSAAVVHALTARRPKARYLVSHIDGFPLVLFRWLVWSMSDRVKDAFIHIQMLKERNFLKAV